MIGFTVFIGFEIFEEVQSSKKRADLVYNDYRVHRVIRAPIQTAGLIGLKGFPGLWFAFI